MGQFPPLPVCRSLVGPRVQLKLLPAFLMSDRKRVACVIYARDFSPGRTGCAVFLHIVRTYVPMQNRSCRISVISADPARVSLYRSRDTARPEENLRLWSEEPCVPGARNSYDAKTVLSCSDIANKN